MAEGRVVSHDLSLSLSAYIRSYSSVGTCGTGCRGKKRAREDASRAPEGKLPLNLSLRQIGTDGAEQVWDMLSCPSLVPPMTAELGALSEAAAMGGYLGVEGDSRRNP